MGKIIVDDIIPIIVIMALGYFCGKFHYFDDDQRQGLNKVVLNIALPAALFISIVEADRQMLFSDAVLTVIGFVGVIVMFMLSYWLCKLLFHHNMQEAAVCALIAGSPTIGFLGFAVLDPIYGNSVNTNLVIGIISIVVNAITIPIGMSLVSIGQAKDRAASEAAVGATAAQAHLDKAAAHPNGDVTVDATKDAAIHKHAEIIVQKPKKLQSADGGSQVGKAIINALKQPVCWSPILAILLVLIGVKIPTANVAPTFELIAKANSGVAVLAAGLALSTVKFSLGKETVWNVFYRNLLTPAVFLVVALLCGMGTDPSKVGMLIMSVALPPAFSGIIISSRYNIYVREGASTVAVSTVVFAATCILWAWLVPVACGWF